MFLMEINRMVVAVVVHMVQDIIRPDLAYLSVRPHNVGLSAYLRDIRMIS